MALFRLEITEEQEKFVEKYYGPIKDIPDEMAIEIAGELLDKKLNIGQTITNAYFLDELTIEYEIPDDEERNEDDVPRGWTEEYLNSLGMSMRDFY